MSKEKEKVSNSATEFYNSKETIDGDIATINFGPTHPATHGIFQNILKVDGEKIISSEQTVGYIHRAFEKLAERRPYNQITPITDRLNYCSSPINNLGWHMTVEKLIQAEIPKRVDYMRVIIMELARIADHLICDSVVGVDTPKFSNITLKRYFNFGINIPCALAD